MLLGRFLSLFITTKKGYKIYFFFPFYHTGGAEKVHTQIVNAVGGPDCIIYFTRHSVNENFRDEFRKSGCEVRDISAYTDNKWLYFLNLIYRGIIIGLINRQRNKPIVFNGQSNFGYKISSWVNKSIIQLELIHAFNSFSFIRMPFLEYYHQSVTVSREIIQLHADLYTNKSVPSALIGKFISIESKIELPAKRVNKDYYSNPFTILYVGRDSFEKRPWLVTRIASLLPVELNVTFKFAGDVEKTVPDDLKRNCIFYGDVLEKEKLENLYNEAHVLIIPSLSESGPLVFMEAMARGAAIISTPVGYIPQHIKNGVSGFVTAAKDEKTVVEDMQSFIITLYKDRELLAKIGRQNMDYAFANFDLNIFNREYQQLISRYTINP